MVLSSGKLPGGVGMGGMMEAYPKMVVGGGGVG